MDLTQDTRTQVKAGDPSDSILKSDLIGGPPYCFRLKSEHPDGAHSAIAPYKPWWKDIKQVWNPELEAFRKDFKRWTLEHATKQEKSATHVAMNSATFYIPLGHEEDKFLDLYAKCLLTGKKMYFVEQLSYAWSVPCFRLFMDLDFKQLKGITERGIEAASKVCSQTVAKFFLHNASNTIVCSTTYKDTTSTDLAGNKLKMIKTGVHLYWPSHLVSPLQCLHIRESIIADLIEAFGPRCEPSMNSWEDVVDQSVYGKANGSQGSGLRMVGSCKTDKCSACSGRGKVNTVVCDVCNGDKRLDDYDSEGRPGRPYMMLCVLNVTGERDTLMEAFYLSNMHQLILDTKLRTSVQEEALNNGFELPAGAPLYTAQVGRKKHAAVPRGERAMEPSDPLHLELQTAVREAFGLLYSKIIVRRVTKGSKQYTINITGTNCRYCQNIGREHNNQNIYFVVTKDGIVQRCYDTGALSAEMRYGLCSDYCSSTIALSPNLSASLWPETVDAISVFATESSGSKLGSFAMRSLLNAGEYLSTRLFGSSWTSTLGLQSSKCRKGLKDFVPQDPRDLGSKGISAYKDLGLAWADALLELKFGAQTKSLERNANEPFKFSKSILELQNALMETFTTIVLCASSANCPEDYAWCSRMDDFLSNACIEEKQVDDGLYFL